MTLERAQIKSLNAKTHTSTLTAGEKSYMAESLNFYRTAQGARRTRPGYTSFVDMAENGAVDGVFWSETLQAYVAVCDGKIKSYVLDGTETDLTSATMVPGVPVTFAEDASRVYMANGRRIVYTDGTAAGAAEVTDVDAPQAATHVAFLDQYIIANDISSALTRRRWYISQVGNGLVWTSTGFASAEAHPDEIVALDTSLDLLYLFGKQTIEIWKNVGTGTVPLRRIGGGALRIGVSATYSIAKYNENFFFLDSNRTVKQLAGSQVVPISTPWVDEELKNVDITSITAHINITSKGVFYVLNCVQDKKSFVYNLLDESWDKWSYRNTTTETNEAYIGRCGTYSPKYGKMLIGSRTDSNLYEVAKSYTDDNGTMMYHELILGSEDFETSLTKRIFRVHLRIQRGEGVADTSHTPVLLLYHRDDGNSLWSDPITIDLGKIGDSDFWVNISNLGRFKSRQWKFLSTESLDLLIVHMDAELRVMRDR